MNKVYNESLSPVSVIIPCYCCAETIECAVASVAAQTCLPSEVILVDDCSGDKTLEKLKYIEKIYPIGWIKVISLLENGGPGTARNVGWESATQPYIAFLDADDAWHIQKIEIQLGWMIKHPEVVLTGHNCDVKKKCECISNIIEKNRVTFYKISKINILLRNPFPTPSVILKANVPFRFSKKKYYSEDYLLWCEICLNSYLCCKADFLLASLFKDKYGSSGLSGKLCLMEKGELGCFFSLYKKSKINFFCFVGLCHLSILKFFKRVFFVYIIRNIIKPKNRSL